MKAEGHFVDTLYVYGSNDSFHSYITEQGYLGLYLWREVDLGTAKQDIWLNPYSSEFPYTVLGRFCLEFACCLNIGHIGYMDIEGIFFAKVGP